MKEIRLVGSIVNIASIVARTRNISQADGKIKTRKKLPLVDVGASFYPNLSNEDKQHASQD